jgi:23S rRNA pseudouridine1911/1915/1917 synthase
VSSPRRFVVPPQLSGLRLDTCLSELEHDWSRSRIRTWIDDERVLLNQRANKASARVKEGDVIIVEEPTVKPSTVPPQNIPLDVIYEDSDLIIVNKASGIVVHPASGNPDGTLVNALLHHCQDLSGIGGVERPGIVHRLDKDTTGLLVVAKSDRAHLALSLAFRRRAVHKTYLAVCYGHPAERNGIVEGSLARHPKDRQRMAVQPRGRAARTHYTVEELLRGASLVSCMPVTGRTHQIRVHMASIGHALVGDPLYAGRQWRTLEDARCRKACKGFPRQALHAYRIAFVHPVSKQEVEFEAPLPEDIEQLLAILRPAD